MNKTIRMKDLAEEAGVSIATVSRVLRKLPGASAETRSRILAIKRQFNYSPLTSAQILAYQRCHQGQNIGIVRVFTRHMRDYGRDFYVDINNGLHLLNDFGYEIIQTQFAEDNLAACPPNMLHDALPIDGVVFVGTAPDNAVEYYMNQDIPIVFADLSPRDQRIPWVAADSSEGLRQLMNFLIENGHRNIAYVNGTAPTYSSRERFDTFRCALLDAGCAFHPEWVFRLTCTVENSEQEWLQLFPRHHRFEFSAVVCENDIFALGIMRACQKNGVPVPDVLSIAGIGDSKACQYALVPLSTVHIPAVEIGRSAAQLLCSLIRRMPIPAGKYTVPTQMVLRESCRAVFAAADDARPATFFSRPSRADVEGA